MRVEPMQHRVADSDALYRKVLLRLLPMLVIVYVIAWSSRSGPEMRRSSWHAASPEAR